jgi:hypothetical protein
MSKNIKKFLKKAVKSKCDLKANLSKIDEICETVVTNSCMHKQPVKLKHKRENTLWQLQGKYENEFEVLTMLGSRWKLRKNQVGKKYYGCTVSSSCKASK